MKVTSIILIIFLILFSIFFSFIIIVKTENVLKLKTESVKIVKGKKLVKEKDVKENNVFNEIIKKYILIKDFIITKKQISRTILLGLIILALLFIILLFKVIDRPAKNLINSIAEIENGDFTVRLPVRGRSKISILYEDFNRMVKNFGKKITVQKYVSKSTAEMLENIKTGEFTSGPQRKNITVFFSDIRGFTTYSEKNDPLIVVERLNELFDIQVKIIARNNGDIDKFVGDSIMAIFPSPQKALNASLEIQKKIGHYNKQKKQSLNIGIGINYGEAVVGAVGSGDSFNWTTIGDTVNVASRICSMADEGTICVSQSIIKKVKSNKRPREKQIKVKGINKPITIYVYK